MKKIMIVSQRQKNETLDVGSVVYHLKPEKAIDEEAKLSIKVIESNSRTVESLLGFELDLGDLVTIEIKEGSSQVTLDVGGGEKEKKKSPQTPQKEKKGKAKK